MIKDLRSIAILCTLPLGILFGSCSSSTTPAVVPPGFVVTALTANTLGYGAIYIDSNLKDAWGIAAGASGGFWIADRASGTAGMPTGAVVNTTGSFVVPALGSALFIFSSLDGTLSAFPQYGATGDSLPIVADRSTTSSFTGLALATGSGGSRLYAADIKSETLDQFDQNFNPISLILGKYISQGYTPFNAVVIDTQLFVTHAKKSGNFVQLGAGSGGYVDIFDLNGNFERNLISLGSLNAPWGIVIAPSSFGSYSGKLLIGNLGDGKINVFDRSTGAQLGTLNDASGNPIVIDGLWALTVYNGTLYYTAGPKGGTDGVFGKIAIK